VPVEMGKSGLARYLTTQTNVIAALQGAKETLGSVSAWLDLSIPALAGAQREFLFGNVVSVLQVTGT
jgi:hypothetical protein